ncbi:hypothetical protein LT330_004235 [Penicillium expansum]|nr:hypothetical protein LT330_004235 [Penicillium expansum]
MRETTHPIYEYSPQAAVQEVLAEICYDAQVSGVRGSCLNDIIRDMEGLGYPLGNASDPLGLGFHPRMIHSIECWAEDLIERTYFSRGNLKDLMPALRTCHIGTDSDLNPIPQRDSLPCILFNETIFTLPNLQKLCITELLLLNCRVSAEDLALIIRFPRALKRLTIRVPLSLEAPYQEDDYTVFSDQLSALHSKSLEYVDADIYGGADYGLGFDSFEVLKEVILTPPSMLANVDEEMILPDSVQKLTIRYEEGTLLHLSPLLDDLKDGNLHNLRSVICQIPDNICEFTTNLEPCVEVAAFKPEFKDFGVELSIEFVPYPLTMPKYDVCPCENLTFYHQFPFHPRARSGPQDEQAANTTVAN